MHATYPEPCEDACYGQRANVAWYTAPPRWPGVGSHVPQYHWHRRPATHAHNVIAALVDTMFDTLKHLCAGIAIANISPWIVWHRALPLLATGNVRSATRPLSDVAQALTEG